MNRIRRIENPYPGRNRGVALLVMLLVVVLAFSAVLVTSLAGSRPEIERQRRTVEALAQAKQALIAWAVMRGDNPATKKESGVEKLTYYRPGNLPCPDGNYFGSASSGNASGSCSGKGETSIGRLPWKSLGMDRLRDGHGEALWYAVSDNFRDYARNKGAINSDSRGSLLLYAADGVTLLTPAGEELAAVVFAPGPPLPGQDRAAQPDAAANYLEAFDGKNNASAMGPFIMGPARDARGDLAVNDLVVGISARELVAALERRALIEAQVALRNHVAEKGRLPNPIPPDGSDCASSVISGESLEICASDETPSSCFGRLPEDVLSEDLSSPVALWFTQNAWGRVMIYAIHDAAAGCTEALSLDGQPLALEPGCISRGCTQAPNLDGQIRSYVLITPGTARDGQTRPSTSLADYLEDAGKDVCKDTNTDAWSGDLNFSVSCTAASNDQLRAEEWR
jgi:type II secretory pathway pseudopilin PulG